MKRISPNKMTNISTPPFSDSYLGDGVYASFDGYHITLDLRGQDNHTKIALEPQVLDALRGYEVYIHNKLKEGKSE